MELHINAIARCLDLPIRKVERWVRQGRIPLVRRGDICAFNREALEKWAVEHNLFLRLDENAPSECVDTSCPPSLHGAMERGGVYHGIQGKDVSAILEKAVGCLEYIDADHKVLLLKKLLEREKLTSTGIGGGVAIPHPRDPLLRGITEPCIATFFPDRPVDFHALDDQPVFVLFMLLCPAVKTHLHLLSRLSFCLRMGDFIAFLRKGPSTESLLLKVASVEQNMDLTPRPG